MIIKYLVKERGLRQRKPLAQNLLWDEEEAHFLTFSSYPLLPLLLIWSLIRPLPAKRVETSRVHAITYSLFPDDVTGREGDRGCTSRVWQTNWSYSSPHGRHGQCSRKLMTFRWTVFVLIVPWLTVKQNQHVKHLARFVEAEARYYARCNEIMQELQKEMSSLPLTTGSSPFYSKPVDFVSGQSEEDSSANFVSKSANSSTKDFTARVLHDYSAKDKNELTVKEGDIISARKIESEAEWVLGQTRDQSGRLPLAYLEIINWWHLHLCYILIKIQADASCLMHFKVLIDSKMYSKSWSVSV